MIMNETDEMIHKLISPSDLELLTNFDLASLNISQCNITQIVTGDSLHQDLALCSLGKVKASYLPFHGYLALVVCLLGTIFNLVNILTLMHKDMRTNPINLILTGIAVADCLVMIEYVPVTIHMYLMDGQMRDKEEKFSLAWAIFLIFHANFSIMIHTVSTWLTLSLAIWRFIMIKFPLLSVTLCTIKRCRTVLLFGYVVPLFLTVPSCFSFHIEAGMDRGKDGECVAFYSVEIANFNGSDLLFSLNMWFYSFFLKLLPCVVLTVFTASLIHALYQAEETRIKRGSRSLSCQEEEIKPIFGGRKNTDRTTRLLIVILVLFLMAEFPLGILGLLSALWGKQFFLECYNPVGEMMDMLVLTNSSINFILYCLMSTQFRATLRKLCQEKFDQVKLRCWRWIPSTSKVENIPLPVWEHQKCTKSSCFQTGVVGEGMSECTGGGISECGNSQTRFL